MTAAASAGGYDSLYREFDSPLMRQLRAEAYGEDIGQHSWVCADELRADIVRLDITPSSRLLDLGCGPCGPLTFVVASTGCSGTGVELSEPALRSAHARAQSLGVASRIALQQADLDAPLPLEARSFDTAMSFEVVCHVRDRAKLFEEVARVLSPGGRFLFTDPCVVTGSITSDEVRRRSVHGCLQFVPAGWNEVRLESMGFRLVETDARTSSVVRNAAGRLEALHAHRSELEHALGAAAVRGQQDYLEIVVELAKRGALSRVMYLAQLGVPRDGQRHSES